MESCRARLVHRAIMQDVKALAKSLKLLATDEFSLATATAINRVAFAAHNASKGNIKREFTLRNNYTLGSMIFYKASPKKDTSKIDALTGSKSPYLDEQDAGGAVMTRQGKQAQSMPSRAARAGSWGKSVTSRFRRSAMGAIGHRSDGGMTPQGARFFWLSGGSLTEPILFFRKGKKLTRVRIATKPLTVKATRWHMSAMEKFGREGIMAAAWAAELSKGLTKIGAK